MRAHDGRPDSQVVEHHRLHVEGKMLDLYIYETSDGEIHVSVSIPVNKPEAIKAKLHVSEVLQSLGQTSATVMFAVGKPPWATWQGSRPPST